MQPYFFPYLGYFQLMSSVDVFVVYDNIQFSKGGWIQRNRMLLNGRDEIFSLPLKKDSDFLDIRDRRLADDYIERNKKILRRFENAYSKAPYFREVFPLVQRCFLFEGHENLFDFLLFSISEIGSFLEINPNIKISSELEGDGDRLKNKARVISLCKYLKATIYINPIGGQSLYNKQEFESEGLLLKFIKMRELCYQQFGGREFVPNLSILDVLMFNDRSDVIKLLDNYDLI
jgi:hypothetical protein